MTSSVILSYARKSIFRNFRRSSTLMIGIIISLAIISGVLFYVDSSTEIMIDRITNKRLIDIIQHKPKSYYHYAIVKFQFDKIIHTIGLLEYNLSNKIATHY